MRTTTVDRISQVKSRPAAGEDTAKDAFPYFFLAILLHIGLALLLYFFRPTLPTLYAMVTLVAGFFALLQKSPSRLVYVCAYIASAELIWRMTKAAVFWEFGKYALVLLMGVGLLRWRMRLHGLALFYFMLLLPGVLLTLDVLPASMAKDQISFDLSGALCLAVGVNFLQNVKLTRRQVGQVLLIGMLPIVSISTLVMRSTVTSNIIFVAASNFATSGGYGPNQVSAMLGLGGLLGWLYLFIGRPSGTRFWLVAGLSSLFILQAVLTLSRGGVINLVLAIPASAFFFLKGVKNAGRMFLLVAAMAVVFALAIPRMDAFTGGVMNVRYNQLSTTGRDKLVKEDLRIWQDHPIFGVGVGISPMYRTPLAGAQVASHTEYSRLLAEHGIPGILAILLLFLIFLDTLRRGRSRLSRGLTAGLMIWAFAEMSHAAMRVAAISFTFSFPLAALYMEDKE